MKAFDERRYPPPLLSVPAVFNPVLAEQAISCCQTQDHVSLFWLWSVPVTGQGSGLGDKCFRQCSTFSCLRHCLPIFLYLELLLSPGFHNSFCVLVRNVTNVIYNYSLFTLQVVSSRLFHISVRNMKIITFFFHSKPLGLYALSTVRNFK
jgi:hypothetical protein